MLLQHKIEQKKNKTLEECSSCMVHWWMLVLSDPPGIVVLTTTLRHGVNSCKSALALV